MQPIRNLADIEAGLEALCALDPRLAAVRAAAGALPLRLSPPGFASLASIIVSQQVRRASAEAIFARFGALVDPLTAEALLAADRGGLSSTRASRRPSSGRSPRRPPRSPAASISSGSARSSPRKRWQR